jgi:predicted PurR-regulated permease PerM
MRLITGQTVIVWQHACYAQSGFLLRFAQLSSRPRGAVVRESTQADARFRGRVFLVAIVLLATAFLGIGLWIARAAIAIMYVSGIIAIGLTPIVDRVARLIGRRGKPAPKGRATFVVYFAGIALVAGVTVFIVPALFAQFVHLRDDLPSMFPGLQQMLVDRGLLSHRQMASTVTSASPATLLRAVLSLIGGIAGFVTIVFLSYYLIVEGAGIAAWALRFAPAGRQPIFRSIIGAVNKRLAAWLRTTVLLGAIMGTTSAVFLGLAGTPFFYVVGVIAAIGKAVPVAGSFVAGVVAVSLAASKSFKLTMIVAAFFLCLHEIEANILVPRMMEKRVGVSSAALIVALLVGFEAAGVTGIVIAVPTATIIAAVLDVAAPEPLPEKEGR